MKKRIFIAINLPERIKDKIERALEDIKYKFTNDVRFIDRSNWHITVSFLGWQNDEFIGPILESMKKTILRFKQPEIEIANIAYGPLKSAPRMIWLNADVNTSKNLASLKDFLESSLMDGGVIFKQEHRAFNVHITLARFQAEKKEALPSIETSLKLNFQAETLDLMESHLARIGAECEVLQQMKFKL